MGSAVQRALERQKAYGISAKSTPQAMFNCQSGLLGILQIERCDDQGH